MAKGQGGIRSNGASAGGFKKGATEEGYTPLMLRNVLGTEERIKNKKNGKRAEFEADS